MATTARKTLVIVGAGPGLGFSLAKAFGARGFRVALVARRKTALDRLVLDLKKLGVSATAYPSDAADEAQLIKTFDYIKHDFGPIDLLEYSPGLARDTGLLSAAATTPKAVMAQFKAEVLGAVCSVRAVLPGMLERKSGAIILTTHLCSRKPTPAMLRPTFCPWQGL